MTVREIKKALRAGTHVIVKFPDENKHIGMRVLDVREKNGIREVKLTNGCWVEANGATIYEA